MSVIIEIQQNVCYNSKYIFFRKRVVFRKDIQDYCLIKHVITGNFFIKKIVNFILYISENWKIFKPEF